MLDIFFLISFFIIKLSVLSPFMVSGPSMLPTLHDGDVIVLNSRAYGSEEPVRGDVVVFSDEKKSDYYYVKRIVGLPGERLHITPDGIYVERSGAKEVLPEPYLAHAAENNDFSLKGYEDELYIVPPGKYFVLGDNRQHSLDSRSFIYPFISKDRIKGKYLFTILDP